VKRRISYKPLALAPLALTASLAGCGKKPAPPPKAPQTVGVVTLHSEAVTLRTQLPGRTDAYEQAQIRPQVGGVILARTFDQGGDLKAGQLMFQINPAPYQALYDQAKAQLLNAQAADLRASGQLARYRPLREAHAVSQQDYDNTLATAQEAKASVAQARATLAQAAVNLEWTKVRSPIDGRAGRTLVTEGTLVTSGQTTAIATVTRLDPIYVDVNLASSDMLRLRRELASGQLQRLGNTAAAVGLELEDGSAYEPAGRLELSEVTVDPSTGTLVMRAVFPNPDHLLLPGMFVHAKIEEGTDPKALLVPQVAVTRTPKGEAQVLVVGDDDKVGLRIIQTARVIGNSWLVTKGLNEGDRVIVSGIQKAHPGAKVHAVPASVDASEDDAKAG